MKPSKTLTTVLTGQIPRTKSLRKRENLSVFCFILAGGNSANASHAGENRRQLVMGKGKKRKVARVDNWGTGPAVSSDANTREFIRLPTNMSSRLLYPNPGTNITLCASAL